MEQGEIVFLAFSWIVLFAAGFVVGRFAKKVDEIN